MLLFSGLKMLSSFPTNMSMIRQARLNNHSSAFSQLRQTVFIQIISLTLVLCVHTSLKAQPEFVFPGGHHNSTTCLSFSADGNKLVSADEGGFILLWDVRSGRLLRKIKEHSNLVKHLAFTADGKNFVTISFDQTIRVWDSKTGKLVRKMTSYGTSESSFAISSDSRWIAYEPKKNNIVVEDLLTGSHAKTLNRHTKSVLSLSFSANNRYLVSTAFDNLALVWDLETARVLHTLDGGSTYFEHAFFLEGDQTICASLRAGPIQFWDWQSTRLIRSISYNEPFYYTLEPGPAGKTFIVHGSKNFAIWTAVAPDSLHYLEPPQKNESYWRTAYNPSGSHIALGTNLGNVFLYDIASGSLSHQYKTRDRDVSAVALSADAQMIASGSIDYRITLWNLRLAKEAGYLYDHGLSLHNARYTPDGKYFITSNYGRLSFWNMLTGRRERQIRIDAYIRNIAVSKDAQLLLTASDDKIIRLWNLQSGRLVQTFTGHGESIDLVRFFSNEKQVMSVSGDKTVRFWNIADGKELRRITLPDQVQLFALDTKEKRMIIRGNETFIWDLATGKRKTELTHGDMITIEDAVFSPDQRFVATGGSDKSARIWNAETGKLIFILRGHTEKVEQVDFSEDDPTLVTVPEFGNAILWNFKTGKRIAELAHADILSVQFVAGSHQLLTAGRDGITKAWDARTGRFQFEMNRHNGWVWEILFNEKMKRFTTTSTDGTSKTWDAADGKLLYTFATVDSSDYFYQLPAGYYMATRGAARLLHYVTPDLQTIGFEQLDLLYNRPDKVQEVFNPKDTVLLKSLRKAYQKRLTRMGLKKSPDEQLLLVPNASITNREAIPPVQQSSPLQVAFSGTDEQSPLQQFNIWVNEVPVFGAAGISLESRHALHFDTALTITLSPGANIIEASVTNSQGVESYRQPVYIRHDGPTPAGVLHFIGIGIDRFRDSTHNLSYSVKDIRDLGTLLAEKAKGAITIDTLFNEAVSLRSVVALRNKLASTSVNDKVVIAYSGHGLLSKDLDYFLSAYDIDFQRPEVTGIPYETIEKLFDSIPARQKLLLLDACHSGEIDKDEMLRYRQADSLAAGTVQKGILPGRNTGALGMQNSFTLMQELFVNVGRSTGATVISAAAGTEFAQEQGKLKNGVFTFSILEYLLKALVPTISGLKEYVQKRVPELTANLQQPTSRLENNAVDWALW
jgi:WD40 repeat protein